MRAKIGPDEAEAGAGFTVVWAVRPRARHRKADVSEIEIGPTAGSKNAATRPTGKDEFEECGFSSRRRAHGGHGPGARRESRVIRAQKKAQKLGCGGAELQVAGSQIKTGCAIKRRFSALKKFQNGVYASLHQGGTQVNTCVHSCNNTLAYRLESIRA